jgi:para-nitrobenzyl esterase
MRYPEAHPASGSEVRVSGGMIRGAQLGTNRVWRGIPYARSTAGELRFRAPEPPESWEGIRDASQFGPVATQAYRGQFRGVGPGVPSGEDCLNINVLRPAGAEVSSEGLPVMVFIHGGGYSAGSSRDHTSSGDAFVRDASVVFVSFNYRLGALGYLDFSSLSTPERRFDSNIGLRDQVAALEWVRDNIREFGGDPDNVTIFGESAGGNAVTTLMVTPAATGLFAPRAHPAEAPPLSERTSAAGCRSGRERGCPRGHSCR